MYCPKDNVERHNFADMTAKDRRFYLLRSE